MILVVDNRTEIADLYTATFSRNGFSAARLDVEDAEDFVAGRGPYDVSAVEGLLLGEHHARTAFLQKIKSRSTIPVLALSDVESVELLLQLFEAGADDVVRKPFHDKEVLARMGAIRRRLNAARAGETQKSGLEIFADGRDPLVDGKPLKLPRREKRILEYLASNSGRRVSRTQVFDAVYGFDDDCEAESVIESHISKLRKKLRESLGYDPIECQRFLGYQFVGRTGT
jgi:two-component system, OmpR family, flagellar system response regulator FtcR